MVEFRSFLKFPVNFATPVLYVKRLLKHDIECLLLITESFVDSYMVRGE